MRPVVAILSARPETIVDDYRRLFELAEISAPEGTGSPLVAVEARGAGYEPGQVCPPWQLEAVLRALSLSKEDSTALPLLLPVNNSGPMADSRGFGWDEILERSGVRAMSANDMAAAPFRPGTLLPALEGILPQGFMISPHLRGKDLFLLSSLSVESGGVMSAHVSLLASLLAADRKTGGKIPTVEILAEIVGMGREVCPSITAVTDATVVSVVRRGGARVPLVRNLLVAGTDPVAVDSVLVRLAGFEPADYPWLHLCQKRGFGMADPSGIRLAGEPEWLDLDFRIPEDTFASGNRAKKFSPGGLFNRLAGGDGGMNNPSAASAWDRLFQDYQSGVTS